MNSVFSPRLDILPPSQFRLWGELAQLPTEFVLYGGTAVALHLGHRQSIDFDFFGDRPLDPLVLPKRVPFMEGAAIIQSEPDTVTGIVKRGGDVKVSFFGLPGLPRLRSPLICEGNGLQVASLLDLAGMKAAVVQKRAEAKDYIDIDAIITSGKIDLPTALGAAKAIYGKSFNPQSTLKALSYFGDGDLGTLSSAVRDRLVGAARAVDLDKLPAFVQGTNPESHPDPGR
jgi:hypothetical protein